MDNIAHNGWTAVPADASQLYSAEKPFPSPPKAYSVNEIPFPATTDTLVAKVEEHVKAKLSEQTYNHSMRVFYLASFIIRDQFPEYTAKLSSSTLALACLLHDLGTAKEFLTSTNMSFDFYGAFKAVELLNGLGATKDTAEAIGETIIRHQDLGTTGNITFLGQVIQLATIYDNVGEYPTITDFRKILHDKTRENVNEAFPRNGWSRCFADTIRTEEQRKPWCHSTHIPDFVQKIESNPLGKNYE